MFDEVPEYAYGLDVPYVALEAIHTFPVVAYLFRAKYAADAFEDAFEKYRPEPYCTPDTIVFDVVNGAEGYSYTCGNPYGFNDVFAIEI